QQQATQACHHPTTRSASPELLSRGVIQAVAPVGVWRCAIMYRPKPRCKLTRRLQAQTLEGFQRSKAAAIQPRHDPWSHHGSPTYDRLDFAIGLTFWRVAHGDGYFLPTYLGIEQHLGAQVEFVSVLSKPRSVPVEPSSLEEVEPVGGVTAGGIRHGDARDKLDIGVHKGNRAASKSRQVGRGAARKETAPPYVVGLVPQHGTQNPIELAWQHL